MNAATQDKLLAGIMIKIHNPQVAAAYADQPFLRNALIIRTADTVLVRISKILIFNLSNGRAPVAATVPMYWAVKIDRSLRQQMAIAFRPEKRRKFKYGKYDRNLQLHIPHYNGDQSPKIPSYIVGQISAKIILKDQSSILVHAEKEEEAERVARALLAYVDPKYLPKEIVVIFTKRKGKALSLEGQRVRPFRGDFYPEGTQTPEWSIQL